MLARKAAKISSLVLTCLGGERGTIKVKLLSSSKVLGGLLVPSIDDGAGVFGSECVVTLGWILVGDCIELLRGALGRGAIGINLFEDKTEFVGLTTGRAVCWLLGAGRVALWVLSC